MRTLARVLFALTMTIVTPLALAGPASAGPSCHNLGGTMYDCDLSQWNEMGSHFETTMNLALPDFFSVKYYGYYKDARLDWTDDGCSNAPAGMGSLYNFQLPCERHDFCYRNSKAFGTFITPGLLVPDVKDACDNKILADMRYTCDVQNNFGQAQSACYGMASTYYNAVRLFG